MSRRLLAVWTLVLANAFIALAALDLSSAFRDIIGIRVPGGFDALPALSKIYIVHERWICAAFTIPLLLAAVIVSARRAITPDDIIVFAAVTLLLIAIQLFFAAKALSHPFIPVGVHMRFLPTASLTMSRDAGLGG